MIDRISRRGAAPLFALAGVLGILGLIGDLGAGAAFAHGFTSVAYADARSAGEGAVAVELKLEYDLLIVSAADSERNDPLFRAGTEAFEAGDLDAQARVLNDETETVLAYVSDRFGVAPGGAERAAQPCPLRLDGGITVTILDGVPYAHLPLVAACPATNDGHVITSSLFPDGEGFVRDTKTIVTYALDLQHGSAALDAQHPSVSTEQSAGERFISFFLLGAEHLLGGIDHILFLLALIAGSRCLREIVLAATSFTVAHSITFILAATGLVSVPAAIVEPIIALSIAVIGAWYLVRLWRRRALVDSLEGVRGPLGIDRSGWTRLGIVFVFGLVHGLGFASALGIDQPWSWTLLWSLLVFNLGIEVVQIAIIAIVFPILVLLRRRAPRLGRWLTAALALAVTIAGLVWFVQRVLGIE